MLWLLVNIRESTLCNCMLHTQHCRPVAVAVICYCGASCLWLPGSRMWRHADNEPRLWQRVVRPQQRRRCAPEAEPRAPSKTKQQAASSKQRTAARLCMDLYTHSATLLSRSLSFVANHPPPPAPSRFPSKRGAALPSLLAPFFESLPLQTNKQQEEFSL